VEGVAAALALRAIGYPWIPAAVAPPSAVTLGKALKRIVSRRRPGIAGFKRKAKESFPSTHVAGPVALLACLWRLAPPTPGWRVALCVGGAATLLAALERVRAGQHWPSDVAAGAVLGVAVGAGLGELAWARTEARVAPLDRPAWLDR
jgi:undecaprenyl-diphosphatase